MDDILDSHSQPIYTCEYLSKDALVTGDDDGMIKIWDLRSKSCIYEVHEQKDGTITGMTYDSQKSYLLSTSNNGTLGVYDLRKSNNSKEKLYALSDVMEEELNCLTFIRVFLKE